MEVSSATNLALLVLRAATGLTLAATVGTSSSAGAGCPAPAAGLTVSACGPGG